jgi:hypothetical protein
MYVSGGLSAGDSIHVTFQGKIETNGSLEDISLLYSGKILNIEN